MQNNISSQNNNELNLFNIIRIFVENKFTIATIIFISILLSLIYIFISSSNSIHFSSSNIININKNINTMLINVLVEENQKSNIAQENPMYQTEIILDRLNKRFSSSSAYEKWIEINQDLSKHLAQKNTLAISISTKSHTVEMDTYSMEQYNALLSYIDFTTNNYNKTLSDNLLNEYEIKLNAIRDDIKVEESKIREQYRMIIIDIESDIFNRSVQVKGAEEELNFIRTNVLKEDKTTPQITLRILDLTNTIQVNKLIIENQKIRKDNYVTFEKEASDELLRLNRVLNETLIQRDEAKYHKIIKLGKIQKRPVQQKKPNNSFVVMIGILSGLILGFFIALLKDEYNKQKISS